MNRYQNKIVGIEELKSLVHAWKRESLKVVFTNGCFDMFHPGHLELLEQAANRGDRLVVAVNANVSVKLLKGEKRPIFDEKDRVNMIAALQFVDAVVLFEDETPIRLIKTLLPDVLVKGDDYNISNIVGADIVIANGGKVELVPVKGGFSTSRIIEKINNL